MTETHRDCSAELGSMTQAMKAQKALAAAAIPSTVVKSDSSSSGRGCSYGIRFSCGQEQNVRTVLKNARIGIKRWNTAD